MNLFSIKELVNLIFCFSLLTICGCRNNNKTPVSTNQEIVQNNVYNNYGRNTEIDSIEADRKQRLNWRLYPKDSSYIENGVVFNILKDTSRHGRISYFVLQMIYRDFDDVIFEIERGHDKDLIMGDFNNDGFSDFKENKSPLRQPYYYFFDLDLKGFEINLLLGEIREIKKGIFCDFRTSSINCSNKFSNLFYLKKGKAIYLGDIEIEVECFGDTENEKYKFADLKKFHNGTTLTIYSFIQQL